MTTPWDSPLYELAFPFSSSSSDGDGLVTVGRPMDIIWYDRSYLLAARALLDVAIAADRLPLVCFPIAYNQRHAFELTLKGVTTIALNYHADYRWLAALRGDINAERPEPGSPVTKHHFDIVLNDLRSALGQADLGSLPTTFSKLANLLAEPEAKAPERLRYDIVRKPGTKAEDKTTEPAFSKETQLDLLGRQEAIEGFMNEHLHFRSFEEKEPNFIEGLCAEYEAETQAVLRDFSSQYLK